VSFKVAHDAPVINTSRETKSEYGNSIKTNRKKKTGVGEGDRCSLYKEQVREVHKPKRCKQRANTQFGKAAETATRN
jgi:hypothetical protein